jgi:hypothetical protein
MALRRMAVATKTKQAPELADEILVHLTRVAPGSMEKEELVDKMEADPSELREALTWLEKEGLLDADADQYRLAENSKPKAGVPSEPPDGDKASAPSPDAPPPASSATTLPVRQEMSLVVHFGRTKDESDDEVAMRSKEIYDSIGEAIEARLPTLDCLLEVKEIETFDSPRRIFPPPDESNSDD